MSRQVEHMLEKSPLTHSFPRLAVTISLSITAIKSNRGSFEAKMVKLLLRLVSQERIGVKETVEAKKQFSKVVNNLVTVEEETFLRYNKFTDRLDTFYAKLCIAEYSALSKEFLIIFCMLHSQSAVERVFNTNADIVADNQSDHSLMALRMVHNHMRSYEVGRHDMKINKELHQSLGKSRQRCQEYLEEQ